MAIKLPIPFKRDAWVEGHVRRSRTPGRIAGEVAIGAATIAIGGFAAYVLKERAQEEPESEVLEEEGAFSLRRYGTITVARIRADGQMIEAMDQGFNPLAEYISAKRGSRKPGESNRKIAMTSPVSVAPTNRSSRWDVRFTMPKAWKREKLPQPAGEVIIDEIPARTLAVLRFSGKGTDERLLAKKRQELLDKLAARGLKTIARPEFAAYNAPIVPGLLRRNEWWVEVDAEAVGEKTPGES